MKLLIRSLTVVGLTIGTWQKIDKHPTFKSDLVKRMANCDYSVLVGLPYLQTIECYPRLFQSFSSRGWLARKSGNVQKDDCVEFVDDLRHIHTESLVAGPNIDDMVTLLSNGPELATREYKQYVFQLCCLCLGYVFPSPPSVRLGSLMRGLGENDLSAVVEPLQSYLLLSQLERNLFTDPYSIANCLEIIDSFRD